MQILITAALFTVLIAWIYFLERRLTHVELALAAVIQHSQGQDQAIHVNASSIKELAEATRLVAVSLGGGE